MEGMSPLAIVTWLRQTSVRAQSHASELIEGGAIESLLNLVQEPLGDTSIRLDALKTLVVLSRHPGTPPRIVAAGGVSLV